MNVLAEFGVVFLLFNIGLELSYERLISMSKYIFGMGSAQMVLSAGQGLTLVHFSAQPEPFLTQKHTLYIPDHSLTPPQ